MMLRAQGLLARLTPRERWLVGVAAALVGLLVAIYAVVLPLGRAHDAAHVRHRQAVAASARLIAQLDALAASAPKASDARGPLAQVVATSADAAGFVLQSNQPRGNDATVIVIPTARPAAALAWLDKLAASGLAVESLAMTPAADGSVAVNATLHRVGK